MAGFNSKVAGTPAYRVVSGDHTYYWGRRMQSSRAVMIKRQKNENEKQEAEERARHAQ